MRSFILTTALLAMVVLAAQPAAAQVSDDIAKAEAALDATWEKGPLGIRKAFFVDGEPTGFGAYEQRPEAKFKAGEKLLTYAEPVGYGWKDNGDGTFSFGFDIDLALKSADGTDLQKQPNFAHLALTSHARNREFFLKLSLDITGAPAGDYIVEYTVRDITTSRSTVISLPFSIVTAR